MILRIKVWPSQELSKQVFIIDGKVLQFRSVDLDLRTFGVQNLTEYGRSLLWDDFKGGDERFGEITTSNIGAFSEDNSEDNVVLNEWVNHLFKESIANLNREWIAAADPETIQAAQAQAEIDKLALDWDKRVVQFDPDPGF